MTFHDELVVNLTRANRQRSNNACIVEKARSWIGVPFLFGQASRQGCNCMGLIVGVLREVGLADLSHLQAGTPRLLPQGFLRQHLTTHCVEVAPGEKSPGDFLLFMVGGVEQNVGIDSGDGRMIHTNITLGRVVEQSLEGWEKRLTGVFRFGA